MICPRMPSIAPGSMMNCRLLVVTFIAMMSTTDACTGFIQAYVLLGANQRGGRTTEDRGMLGERTMPGQS